MNTRHLSVLAIAAITLLPVSGCSMFEGESDERKPATDMSFYSGVPSNAIRAASGHGTIRYRATSGSQIIIGDDSRRVVITQATLQSGEEVVVNPEGDSVTINGRVIYNQNLQKNDQHSIFVMPM